MLPRRSQSRNQALTLVDVVVLLAMVTLLAALLLPALAAAKRKAQRINCVNNLEQIGQAYRIWAADNFDQYPLWATNNPHGSIELMRKGVPDSQLALWNFMIMSNELATSKILHCPADPNSTKADDFTNNFSSANISYFASLDASFYYPQMILSGDDNLLVDGSPVQPGILNIATNSTVAWTNERHRNCGNIGMADCSTMQVSSAGLQQALSNAAASTTNTFNRFAIP
jgi:type II secretory pathway pseudopilin PulG